MTCLRLKLEPFGGYSISECAKEAIKLANTLQITVMFKFNDVECMACPGDNAEKLAQAYFDEGKSESKYKVARGRA